MPVDVQYEVRKFAGGLDNSTSVFGVNYVPNTAGPRTRGSSNPKFGDNASGAFGAGDSFSTSATDVDGTGVWIRPASGGVLEAYPRTNVSDAETFSILAQARGAVYARAAAGTERIVAYGKGTAGGIDKIVTLDHTDNCSEGAEINDVALTAADKRPGLVVYKDQICVCNGVDQPIAIDITTGDSAEIGATRPAVANATATVGAAGNVIGVVRYYLAQMSGSPATNESALSVSFGGAAGEGSLDCSATNEGQGVEVVIDISHADFLTSTGTNADTHAGTQLTDGGGATFQTDGVQVGMIVKNTTDGSTGVVTSVDSELQLTHTQLSGGSDNSWDSGDDWQVAPIYRIYRSYADQVQANYLGELNPAVDTSFTDNIRDEELGGLPRLHGDQPLTAFTDWVVHRGRLFAIGGSKLYFSDPNEYSSWFTGSDGNWEPVHEEDGDICTALARVPDGLLIFKRNHIYKLLGDSENNFRLSDAISTSEGSSVGTPHPQSLVSVPGGVLFYWGRGVYAYSNGQISRISRQVESQWLDPTVVFPTDDGVTLGYDPRFSHVYVSFDHTTPGTPGSTFIFDITTAQWIGASSDAAAKTFIYDPGSAVSGGRVPAFYALSANGLTNIRKLAYDKLGTASATTEKSRFTPASEFSGSDPNTMKRWLYMDFFFTAGTENDNVTITPQIDGTDASVVTVPLPVAPGRKRVNIGELGYRMTYEFKETTTDATVEPWGVYEVVAAYQEMPGRSV